MKYLAASIFSLLSLCASAQTSPDVHIKSPASFLLTEAQFEALFPKRIAFYTYAGLLEAITAYPEFTRFGSELENKRELAAFLANIMHESHHLQAITEVDTRTHDHYCNDTQGIPCAKGKQYYGRGPIQLSWNFNYAMAGKALGLDLLNDPDMVARVPAVAWKTALWYWMEIPGSGPVSSHQAMKQNKGFGETVRSINGALECSKPTDNIGYQQQQMRIQNYLRITQLLGVDPGNYRAC